MGDAVAALRYQAAGEDEIPRFARNDNVINMVHEARIGVGALQRSRSSRSIRFRLLISFNLVALIQDAGSY